MSGPSTPVLPREPEFLDSDEQLESVWPELQRCSILAIDTEMDSYHSYFDCVCLIQISTEDRDLLLDPLSPSLSLDPLGEIFADESIVKIFHAGENDVKALKREYDFEFRNLFDTHLVAQILGYQRHGLAGLLAEYFDVHLDKKMQTSDWSQRPLTREQLIYAACDTHFLTKLRSQMLADLERLGRVEEAQSEFDRIVETEPARREFDPLGYLSIRGAKDIKPQALSVLRELYLMRDARARSLNCPPHRVLSDQVLIVLARRRPRTREDLKRTRALSAWRSEDYGAEIIEAIARGRAAGPHGPIPKRHKRNDQSIALKPAERKVFDRLRAWRVERAEQRGVDASRVATNRLLADIVRTDPRDLDELLEVPGMEPWRIREYGEEILSVVNGARGSA
ncbi:MAG: HRDC domain-containing protein [Planctomycetota bacterium]